MCSQCSWAGALLGRTRWNGRGGHKGKGGCLRKPSSEFSRQLQANLSGSHFRHHVNVVTANRFVGFPTWAISSPCQSHGPVLPLTFCQNHFPHPHRTAQKSTSRTRRTEKSVRSLSGAAYAHLACIDMCNPAPFPHKRNFRDYSAPPCFVSDKNKGAE